MTDKSQIMVPIAPGELVDKLTILRLKSEKISDSAKLANVQHELRELQAVADAHIPAGDDVAALWDTLYSINQELWQIEDDIRECESRQDFGPDFIRLARAVYFTNDRRADVKKQMNVLLGSAIVEEKSYQSTDAV